MRQSFLPRIGIYDAGCIFAQKRDKVKTLSLFWAQKAGLVRSEATEQRSLQSRHKRAAWQGADRVTLFRRFRFRSRKARCPQTAFAVCPKRQKAKARHTGRRALRLARQEQPRLNQAESDLQYIFLNGVAGIVARRQAEPKKYANNYNVHGIGGKFVKRQ